MNYRTLGTDIEAIEEALDNYVTCGKFSMVEKLARSVASYNRGINKPGVIVPQQLQTTLDNLENMDADTFSKWYRDNIAD